MAPPEQPTQTLQRPENASASDDDRATGDIALQLETQPSPPQVIANGAEGHSVEENGVQVQAPREIEPQAPLEVASFQGTDLKAVKAQAHSHGQMRTGRTANPKTNGFCASFLCSVECGSAIKIDKCTKGADVTYVATGHWL